ncbi:MAG: hypothetical protein WBQ03_25565 [Candidatus Sulfotelmatobacter sp.]
MDHFVLIRIRHGVGFGHGGPQLGQRSLHIHDHPAAQRVSSRRQNNDSCSAVAGASELSAAFVSLVYVLDVLLECKLHEPSIVRRIPDERKG